MKRAIATPPGQPTIIETFTPQEEADHNAMLLVINKEGIVDGYRTLRQKKFKAMGFPEKLLPAIELDYVDAEIRGKLKALRKRPESLQVEVDACATIDEARALTASMQAEVS